MLVKNLLLTRFSFNSNKTMKEKKVEGVAKEVEQIKSIENNVEIAEQTLRRKLMARLRAQRARETKKAQKLNLNCDSDATSSSSTESESEYETNQGISNCNVSFFANVIPEKPNSEGEFPVADCSYDALPTCNLDPLQMEPNEDRAYEEIILTVPSSINELLSTELNRIDDDNVNAMADEEDDDDNEGEKYFKKTFQDERLRIENALKYAESYNVVTQHFELKDEEPVIDFMEFSSVFEWNPLDCDNNVSPRDVVSNVPTFTLNQSRKIGKRQVQAERMRKLRAKKKQLETPEEELKRKENQRQRAERSRLKKKAIQAGVLIESDIDEKGDNERNKPRNLAQQETKRPTRYQAKQKKKADENKPKDHFLKNVEINSSNSMNSSPAQSVKQCLDDALHAELPCGSLDSRISSPDSVIRNRTRCAQRARERRAAETKEETEARRLRARIAKMKHRLFVQLAFSEEQLQAERARKAEEMRSLRQKRRAAETPEQTAERKRKQVLQARKSRSRILAAETPEEIALRKVAGREYCRKRISKLEPTKTFGDAESIERVRDNGKQGEDLEAVMNSAVTYNNTGYKSGEIRNKLHAADGSGNNLPVMSATAECVT